MKTHFDQRLVCVIALSSGNLFIVCNTPSNLTEIFVNARIADPFVQNLNQLCSQQVEKDLVLMEGKILRLGGQYEQLFFLYAAYETFRSASVRGEVQTHLQRMVNRMTSIFCRVVDGQEQFLPTSTASMIMNAPCELNQPVNEVRVIQYHGSLCDTNTERRIRSRHQHAQLIRNSTSISKQLIYSGRI